MQDHQVCPEPACPTAAEPAARSIDVAEIVERFEREATRGICDTGRYRMPYYVWGQGPPLVFIHGVADTAHSFRLVISQLSAHFRCIAYTLPQGYGDASRLWRYRHEHLVADLWALFDHLKLDRAYVLGSSFGSTVALAAMRDRPSRIPRAILQGGVACRPLRFAERAVAWWLRFFPGPMAKLVRRDRILNRVHRPTFEGLAESRWQAFVDWTGEARLAALGHQARMLHRVDLRADLPRIEQPVMLMHGDRDMVMPRFFAEQLLAGLPGSGLVVLEGAGHVPCYTHPEAMAEVVRRFLTPAGFAAPTSACSGQGGCSPAEQAACQGTTPTGTNCAGATPTGASCEAHRHPLPCQHGGTVSPSSSA